MSLEDLKKAIAEVDAIIWAACEPNSLGREKMADFNKKFSVFLADYERMQKDWAKDRDAMFDYLTEAEELKREIKAIKIENVVVPRADYDLQVHVPRKQLFDKCAYVDFEGKPAIVCNLCRFYHGLQKGCSWEEEKKELLEATQK